MCLTNLINLIKFNFKSLGGDFEEEIRVDGCLVEGAGESHDGC